MKSANLVGSSAALVVLLMAAAPAPGAGNAAEELRITAGRSIVIDYVADIARISTSNPDVVDAVAVSTREILLHAKSLGVGTVVVWAKSGERRFYNITVEHNLEPFRQLLAATFPRETIQLQATRESVTLTGTVSSPAVSERAAALVSPLAKTVVNNLDVTPEGVEKQIMLKVRFAELNRNASHQFGTTLVPTGFLNTIGTTGTGQFPGPRPNRLEASRAGRGVEFTITDALNIFAFRPDLDLAAFVRLLQGQGILQILAEPNLVTTNAKEASFLVGGEFPVPVLQGGANAGAVTIQFREFGIRLTFTPRLTSNETIKMYVKPEVSTIDLANAVTFSGFVIPALATRRMETNIELAEKQSFVIAGLLDDRANDTFSKIPGLANIPVLGALFKSRAENKAKTELVVIVTPEVVRALAPSAAPPGPVMPLPFLAPSAAPAKPASNGGAEKTK